MEPEWSTELTHRIMHRGTVSEDIVDGFQCEDWDAVERAVGMAVDVAAEAVAILERDGPEDSGDLVQRLIDSPTICDAIAEGYAAKDPETVDRAINLAVEAAEEAWALLAERGWGEW